MLLPPLCEITSISCIRVAMRSPFTERMMSPAFSPACSGTIAGNHSGDDRIGVGQNADLADLVPAFRDWRHSRRNGLTASQHGHGDVAVGTPDSDRDIEVLPRRDSVPRHGDDAVASHQAGFLCRRARHHGPDQRRLIEESERARPECPGRMPSRRPRAGCSSPGRRRGSESAATWSWRGTRRVDRIGDLRVLAGHLDVAAERHCADADSRYRRA